MTLLVFFTFFFFFFFFFNDTATTEIYTLSLQTLFRSAGSCESWGSLGKVPIYLCSNGRDLRGEGIELGADGREVGGLCCGLGLDRLELGVDPARVGGEVKPGAE